MAEVSMLEVRRQDPTPSMVSLIGASLLVGLVGLLWLSQAKPSEGQAHPPPAPLTPSPTSPLPSLPVPTQSTTPAVLKFTLSLSAPDDLKVRQGDAVAKDQVLADRTRQRQQLSSQQQKTRLSLQRIQAQTVITPPPPAPVPPVRALPAVSFATQEAAILAVQDHIELQQRKLDLLQTLPPDQVPPAMREHEERILEGLYSDLAAAQAELQKAQEDRKYQEYEYSLAMAQRAEQENQQQLSYSEQLQRVEQQQRDREFQIAQLETQMQEIDRQLADLSTVRSPYGGTIRRIKWLGQSDNTLTVEITLAVAGPGEGNVQSGPGEGNVRPGPAVLPVPVAP